MLLATTEYLSSVNEDIFVKLEIGHNLSHSHKKWAVWKLFEIFHCSMLCNKEVIKLF